MEKAGFNYGFVNAMVLGFLSKLYMETAMGLYAHAASLSLNGVGILIAGDHKAGKSTLISKILSIAEDADDLDLGIVSDDWILLNSHGDILEASRLSEEFRIDKKTIMNPHFGVSQTFNALTTSDIEDSTAKIQIPLQDICLKMQLNNLQAIRQDKIVILDPTQESYITIVDSERALEILSASSANVPPLNAQEYEHFRAFWMAQFDTHETFTLNNRHPSSTLKKVADTVITLSRR